MSVTDDLPLIAPGMNHISIEVVARLKNGEEVKAFYADNYEQWYHASTCRRIKQEVIAWKSIDKEAKDT